MNKYNCWSKLKLKWCLEQKLNNPTHSLGGILTCRTDLIENRVSGLEDKADEAERSIIKRQADPRPWEWTKRTLVLSSCPGADLERFSVILSPMPQRSKFFSSWELALTPSHSPKIIELLVPKFVCMTWDALEIPCAPMNIITWLVSYWKDLTIKLWE